MNLQRLLIACVICFCAPLYASQVNVIFKPGVSSAEQDRSVLRAGGASVRKLSALNTVTANIPDGASWNSLKNDPAVQAIEVDGTAQASNPHGDANGGKPQPPPPPPPAETIPTGVDRIDGEQILTDFVSPNTGFVAGANTGAGIIVAIVDTGIDLTHPDLVDNLYRNPSGSIVMYNAASVKPGTSAQDDNGHGTHVAGTVAAVHNTQGVVGVAPQAKLMAVKVLDRNGSGSYSAIAAGITWAADNGADVINMSLGGSATSATLENAVQYAASGASKSHKKVVIVCAAGNSGPSNNTVEYPGKYVQCIAVSAWTDTDGKAGGLGPVGPTFSTGGGNPEVDDTLASFSSRGPEVDIAAPGVSILSTWKGGGYDTISGTSMASPHVAGVMARILFANPGSTDPRSILYASYTDPATRPAADAPHNDQIGAGILSAVPQP